VGCSGSGLRISNSDPRCLHILITCLVRSCTRYPPRRGPSGRIVEAPKPVDWRISATLSPAHSDRYLRYMQPVVSGQKSHMRRELIFYHVARAVFPRAAPTLHATLSMGGGTLTPCDTIYIANYGYRLSPPKPDPLPML